MATIRDKMGHLGTSGCAVMTRTRDLAGYGNDSRQNGPFGSECSGPREKPPDRSREVSQRPSFHLPSSAPDARPDRRLSRRTRDFTVSRAIAPAPPLLFFFNFV